MLAAWALLADAEVAIIRLNATGLGLEIGKMDAKTEPVFSATLSPISYNAGQAL